MDGFIVRLIREVKKRPWLWDRNHEHFNYRAVTEAAWEELAITLDRDKTYIRKRWKNLADTYKKELKSYKMVDGKGFYAGCWRLFDEMSFTKDSYLASITAREKWIKNRAALNMCNPISGEFCGESSISNFDKHTAQPPESNDGLSNCSEASQEDDQNDEVTNHFDSMFVKVEPDLDEYVQNTNKEQAADFFNDFDSSMRQENEDTVKQRSNKRKLNSPKNKIDEEVKKMRMDAPSPPNGNTDEDVSFMMSLVPFLKRLNPIKKLLVRNEIQNLLIKELICDNCKVVSETVKPICGHHE